ncbi:putative zinc finger protein [Falsibacillus pallidus]|uniref:Putative zinc finger protein n=2 Tax=Falsibacillus pallidus TaxID=493781 RepID=A0A370GCZ9_9BACI|nr:putative zinc finger protein [Falsibacillus pallidus]
MPSYIDHLCSQDSVLFIEEHIKSCAECREVLENMKEDINISDGVDEIYQVEVKKPFQKIAGFFNSQKRLARYLLLAALSALILSFIFLIPSLMNFNEHKKEVEKLKVVEKDKHEIMNHVFQILGSSTELSKQEEEKLLATFKKYSGKLNLLAVFPAEENQKWLQDKEVVKQKPTAIYPIEYKKAAIVIGNEGIIRKDETIQPSGYDLGTVVMANKHWIIQYEYKHSYEPTVERHHQLTYYGPSTWSFFQTPLLLCVLFSVLFLFWLISRRLNKHLKDIMG